MKKSLILFLALVITMALAAGGCQATPSAAAVSPTVSPAATSTDPAASEQPKLDPVKLTWYMMIGGAQRQQDEVFALFSKYVQSKINATLDILPLEWGTYTQKLQTAAAAGEEFDVVWVSDWMTPFYTDLANKGAIIPIDDLMAKYAPQTKSLIADKFWDKMKIGGKIYGAPCYQIFYRQNGMWVSKELADKYKFDPKAFKTYKDLEPFYDAILAGEKDIVPLASSGGLMGSFTDGTGPTPDRGPMIELSSGIAVYASNPTKMVDRIKDSPAYDDFKAKILAARDWYLKKYVRQDLMSIQDIGAEIKTKRYASGGTMMKPGGESEFKDTYGFDVYIFPVGKPVLSGVTATELAISATGKNPERAMMFIELLNTDKYAYNLIANGVEGKNYIKTGENRISRVENNGYQPNISWTLGNTCLSYLVPGLPDDVNEQVKANNDAAEPAFMADWNFNNEKVKNEIAASESLWNEYGYPLASGVLDPATKLPEYLNKISKAGHDAIVVEVAAQFQTYLDSHK